MFHIKHRSWVINLRDRNVALMGRYTVVEESKASLPLPLRFPHQLSHLL